MTHDDQTARHGGHPTRWSADGRDPAAAPPAIAERGSRRSNTGQAPQPTREPVPSSTRAEAPSAPPPQVHGFHDPRRPDGRPGPRAGLQHHPRSERRPGRRREPHQALALTQDAPAESGPWRLSEALGTPDWFEIKGTLRHRYEAFDEQFRASGGGENHAFVHRALVEMTVRSEYLSATAELEDSRVYSGVSNAPMNTGIVNTLESSSGYVAGDFTDAFEEADELRVQLGRHTMDVGSRRLVARNRYRNTINAFNGLNTQWRSGSGVEARAFYTLPVQRLPRSASDLYDGDVRFDEERSSVRFWGGHVLFPRWRPGMDAELYLFGIDESDADGLNTRDRDLITFGTRWQKPRAAGDFFWELESVFQTGESRSSSGSTRISITTPSSTTRRWATPSRTRTGRASKPSSTTPPATTTRTTARTIASTRSSGRAASSSVRRASSAPSPARTWSRPACAS